MATSIEIRTTQKSALHDLLTLKMRMQNEKDGAGYKWLIELINKMETVMEEEDVAYVEKKVAELYQ